MFTPHVVTIPRYSGNTYTSSSGRRSSLPPGVCSGGRC
jgi:hypothetical protein